MSIRSLLARAVVSVALLVVPMAALGQSSSAALGDLMAAELGRPLTPPEAWAAKQAARDHLGAVQAVRARYVEALARATAMAPEEAEAALPPLGRGTLSGERDPRPALEASLGRSLTAAEGAAVAEAEAARTEALAPHRQALVDRLAALTGLESQDLLPALAALGL